MSDLRTPHPEPAASAAGRGRASNGRTNHSLIQKACAEKRRAGNLERQVRCRRNAEDRAAMLPQYKLWLRRATAAGTAVAGELVLQPHAKKLTLKQAHHLNALVRQPTSTSDAMVKKAREALLNPKTPTEERVRMLSIFVDTRYRGTGPGTRYRLNALFSFTNPDGYAISKHLLTKAKMHALYPGPGIPRRKRVRHRMRVSEAKMERVFELLLGHAVRSAFGTRVYKLAGGKTETIHRLCLEKNVVQIYAEEVNKEAAAVDLPEDAQRCTHMKKRVRCRNKRANGSAVCGCRNSFTPPNFVCFKTVEKVMKVLCPTQLRTLAGLDEISVEEGYRNFMRGFKVDPDCLVSFAERFGASYEEGKQMNAEQTRHHTFLIGETFMRAEDPGAALAAMFAGD